MCIPILFDQDVDEDFKCVAGTGDVSNTVMLTMETMIVAIGATKVSLSYLRLTLCIKREKRRQQLC